MHFPSFARFAPLCAALLAASGAAAYDFEINYHEHIELLDQRSNEDLSFIAFGRQFDLELERNNGIAQNSTAELYRGSLRGYAGSWARVSRNNDRLSGVIWDGEELWLIDSHDRLNPFFTQADTKPPDTTVVFPLSEMSFELSDVVLADWANIDDLPIPDTAPASFGPQPGRILDIGLLATADFRNHNGANAENLLLEIFNIVEGIFITQVGVQLRAAEIRVFDTDPAGLEVTNASDLLSNFGSYKATTPELSSLGLAHLFASRDLEGGDDAETNTAVAGLAYLSSLCSQQFGVGLTQATRSSIIDALIFAHELGHNFGAPHDGETDSACEAEPETFIMAPSVSGNPHFSQCSIDQMLPEILGATCVTEVPPTDLQLSVTNPLPATIDLDSGVDFRAALTNLSAATAVGVEVRLSAQGVSQLRFNNSALDQAPTGSCGSSENEAWCIYPYFEALATTDIRADGIANTPGPLAITLEVDSLNELDSSNNTVQLNVDVLPPELLISNFSPIDATLTPGQIVQYELSVRNDGSSAADNVLAIIEIFINEFSFGEVFEVTSPACSSFGPREYACALGTLAPGAEGTASMAIRLRDDIDPAQLAIAGHYTVRQRAMTGGPDFPTQNRAAFGTLTIGESISDLSVQVLGPSATAIGEPTTWEITLSNGGPDAADAVSVVNDRSRAPPSDNVSISATGGSCTLTGNDTEFECTFDRIAAGESATITLTATPNELVEGAMLEAVVESATAGDTNLNNNLDRLSLIIGPAAPQSAPVASGGGGGGGGNTGFLSLFALLAAIAVRRSTAHRRCCDKYDLGARP